MCSPSGFIMDYWLLFEPEVKNILMMDDEHRCFTSQDVNICMWITCDVLINLSTGEQVM